MKKKPETQNVGGAPLSIHNCMKFKRSIKSFIHDPSGLSDGYATLCHISGTWLSNTLLKTYSKSALITTKPSIALPKSIND